MICTTCGSEWADDDAVVRYHFRSASFSIGSYTSPAVIFGLAEEMTFCPKCNTGRLQSLTDDMNGFRTGKKVAEDRYDDGEQGSDGDADVVHSPILTPP